MKLAVIAVAIILGSVLLHLLALWAERRGWIYYKHTKPSRSALGTVVGYAATSPWGAAFLEVQSILEPNKKHIIEIKKDQKKANEESGDEPGDDDSESQWFSRMGTGLSQEYNQHSGGVKARPNDRSKSGHGTPCPYPRHS